MECYRVLSAENLDRIRRPFERAIRQHRTAEDQAIKVGPTLFI